MLPSEHPGKARVFRYKTGGKLKTYSINYTHQEISDMAHEIGAVTIDLMKFLDERGPPSRETKLPPIATHLEPERPTENRDLAQSPTPGKE